DTWWQTETGGNIITPLPAATPLKPGVATLPLPGLAVEILEKDGGPTSDGEKGLLCITKPWPSMLRGVWGAPKRYEDTYFKTVFKNGQPVYFSGDGACRDEDGYIVITGRVDDVINTAGHRVGTAEVESAIADHPAVAESGVIGVPDDIRGEKIVAFVVLKNGQDIDETALAAQLNQLLKTHLGPVVQVSQIFVAPGLPKTRSGKILRRILRHIASAEPVTADISTLEDPTIVAALDELVRSWSLPEPRL
ncbi:acetyl-coenzyme A synthetase, partial [Candidatus Saccharibacteria bacterium]